MYTLDNQKLVNEQEEQLAAEMHVLTIHAEGIHRLYLCFQTLIGEEHDIIDRLYVKGELYKSVEQDMGLNHRIFEGKRKQAIRDIQKLYESDLSNSVKYCHSERECLWEKREKKSRTRISI